VLVATKAANKKATTILCVVNVPIRISNGNYAPQFGASATKTAATSRNRRLNWGYHVRPSAPLSSCEEASPGSGATTASASILHLHSLITYVLQANRDL